MPFEESGGLRFFRFDIFPANEVIHGIFTRQGGASPIPWDTLNLGGTVGDERQNVIENRRRMFAALGRKVESIYDVWQVHSKDVICTNKPRPLEQAHLEADAILTDREIVTLAMRFADCVPIMLFDPVKKVVGLVHAGWQGTVNRIASEAVHTMLREYHCNPADILAGIGPSIGPDHYEFEGEATERVVVSFPDHFRELLIQVNGHTHLDLWRANEMVLKDVGVNQIEIARICTACNLQDWYSHRGEKGKTGRFGTIIALRERE